MEKRFKLRFLAILLIGFSLFICCRISVVLINVDQIFEAKSLVISMLIMGSSLLLGSFFMTSSIIDIKKRNTFLRYVNYFLFGIYVVVLIVILFFDEIVTRTPNAEHLSLHQVFSTINIIPLKTISIYINDFHCGMQSIAMQNLIGNIIVFMPMGYFIPLLYKKAQKIRCFIFVMTLLLISIELLQLISMRGVCDIDDILLNMIGAVIAYGIGKISIIKRVIMHMSGSVSEEGH